MLKRDISSGRKRLRRGRRESGFSLVETLVSLLVGAVIAGTMVDMYSKVQRVGVTTQNEMLANIAVSELIDQTRALDYEFLAARVGNKFDLLPNRTDVGQSTSAMRNDPVLLDLVGTHWTEKAAAGRFKGSMTYEIQPVPGVPEAVKVIVVASWTDSERLASGSATYGRSRSASTIVSKSGFNLWQR